MPAHSIKPELHVPAPQLKREQSLVALFYPAKRQLLRVLKYIARTLLKLSFLSSSPTTPAMQSISVGGRGAQSGRNLAPRVSAGLPFVACASKRGRGTFLNLASSSDRSLCSMPALRPPRQGERAAIDPADGTTLLPAANLYLSSGARHRGGAQARSCGRKMPPARADGRRR